MAHNLEMVKGKASMAWAGDEPWHGLGTQVPDNLSAAEMMAAAGLDWRVEEVETFAMFRGEAIPTGQKALIRDLDGAVLTQVGKDWHPVQNEEAFDFFKDFVDVGHMSMETAGSLNGGKMVWGLAKIKDGFFDVFGGDRTEGYLLFSNPHEYGKTIDIRMSSVRTVCQNTLTLSLGTKSNNFIKVNHRRKFNADEVKETMGIAADKMNRFKEMALFLGSKRTTKETLTEYFGDVFGTSKTKENRLSRTGQDALEYIHTQPGTEFAEGSWWQAFNTVTFMTNHILGRSNDTRMQSLWYGQNQKLNTKALETALDYANNA